MPLNTYSTGTVAISSGGAVTVSTGIWTGPNVVAGDMISVDGAPALLINDVTDATHGQLVGWSGGSVSGKTYIVYKCSSLRWDDVKIAEDAKNIVAATNVQGYPVIVPDSASAPDPSLGNENQPAIQFNAWKWWKKEGGLWNLKGSPAGLLPANALSEIAALGKQADARTNLGGTTVGKALFTAVDAAAGRTAINAQIAGSYQAALGYTPVNKAGDTMSGVLTSTGGGFTANSSGAYGGVLRSGSWNGGAQFIRVYSNAAGGTFRADFAVQDQANSKEAWFQLDCLGNFVAAGSITGASKSFLIDHPSEPLEKDLVFMAPESSAADVYFRGVIKLIDGQAVVDIDAASNLSPGTFVALTQDAVVRCLNNLDGFTQVRASRVVDGKFTIYANDSGCTDEVSWFVSAERADHYMRTNPHCDPVTGKLIPEHDKPDYPEAA